MFRKKGVRDLTGGKEGSIVELDDPAIERVLRWAMIENGAAGLSDELGRTVIVPSPPSHVLPPGAAVAGRVILFRRQRPAIGAQPPSSFVALRAAIAPGAVVMVRCEADIGAAFGSNVALQAAACRAQAILTDGAFRDTSRLQQVGIPIGSNGAVPTRPAGCPMVATDAEEMFGVTWHNGDWLLRDADGVLRLDADLAHRTASELARDPTGELAQLLATSDVSAGR